MFLNNLAASMAKRLRQSSLFDSLKKPRNSEVAGVSGCMPESTNSEVEQDEANASEELEDQPLDQSECFSTCCADKTKAYQPTNKIILSSMANNGRNFVDKWYKPYP